MGLLQQQQVKLFTMFVVTGCRNVAL